MGSICLMTPDMLMDRIKKIRFFNNKLEQILTVDEDCAGGGLFRWIKSEGDFGWERSVINKFVYIKKLTYLSGDSAVEYFEQITSPDETNEMLMELAVVRRFLPEIQDEFCSIKKKEFNYWLGAYNEFALAL